MAATEFISAGLGGEVTESSHWVKPYLAVLALGERSDKNKRVPAAEKIGNEKEETEPLSPNTYHHLHLPLLHTAVLLGTCFFVSSPFSVLRVRKEQPSDGIVYPESARTSKIT